MRVSHHKSACFAAESEMRSHRQADMSINSVSVAAGGRCSSMTAISVDTATGFHVLKVDGYSKIEVMLGHGRSVDSDAFNVGGYSWRMKCYIDGEYWQTRYCLSLFLLLDDLILKGSYVDARVQFSILVKAGDDIDGEPAGAPYTAPCQRNTFLYQDKKCGYDRFIEKRDLTSSPYLKNDSLWIRCDVTVLKQTHTEPIVVPPADLHRHLGALLDGKVGGDVTFEVGGELITAHRYVLAARSSVFMAELFGPMKEAITGARVPIHDMEARVFKVFLHFIYTDSLPEMDDGGDDKAVMAQHLLVAADRYNMERLRLICEDTLRSCVEASTVATTLVLAEQHGYHGLKEACFKFLKCDKGNLEALMASAGFQHLKSSCPSLLEELLAKVAL